MIIIIIIIIIIYFTIALQICIFVGKRLDIEIVRYYEKMHI